MDANSGTRFLLEEALQLLIQQTFREEEFIVLMEVSALIDFVHPINIHVHNGNHRNLKD